jgi:pyruvate/2-oxoglutarate dehydrogenase complex dihydrolipoamide dehydrogenase (E3) component
MIFCGRGDGRGFEIGGDRPMPAFLTPDICIIGGGPAGLAVARTARRYGASVVLIEKDRLGGAGLHAGSIPAKALAAAARRAHDLRTAANFGIGIDELRINARGVFDYVQRVIADCAPALTIDHLKADGVEVIAALARFLDARTIEAGGQRLRPRRVVIATGSRAAVPELPGLSELPYFTTSTIFDNPRKLTHLVILGPSAAAVELAQAFRRLGAQVTLIDPGLPLASTDSELAEIALRRLADEGVDVRPDTTPAAIQPRSLGIGVVVRRGDAEETLDASHLLVAGPHLPVLDGLDVEKADIRRGTRGELLLKPTGRTSNRRVYAIGDATGDAMQSHGLDDRAERLARHLLFRLPIRARIPHIPTAIFTDPEIATVGLTEAEARRRKIRDFRILRLSLAENDRARIENQTYGLVKLLVANDGRLLGAAIAGTGAAEMISLFAFAIGNRLSLAQFRNFVAPYPTLTGIARSLADDRAARSLPESKLLARLLRLNRVLP